MGCLTRLLTESGNVSVRSYMDFTKVLPHVTGETRVAGKTLRVSCNLMTRKLSQRQMYSLKVRFVCDLNI